jgi:enoyl-CoA hydratase
MSDTEMATGLENIMYEVRGSIAYITMNRPKVMNALITNTRLGPGASN